MSRIFDDVVVTPINKEMVAARLAELRAEHPAGLTNMDDLFGMALLMANFEWRIEASDSSENVLVNMELPEFLKLLFNCNFFDVNRQFKRLTHEAGAISIGVHHQQLEKHFLVQITEDGIQVIHNVHALDVPSNEFEVEINIAFPVKNMDEVMSVGNTYRLSANAKEPEIGEFIDAAWLHNFEGDNLVIEIPGYAPHTMDSLEAFRAAKLRLASIPDAVLECQYPMDRINVYMAAMLAVVRDEHDEDMGDTHVRVKRVKERLTTIVSNFELMKKSPSVKNQDDFVFADDLSVLSVNFMDAYMKMMKKYKATLAG